MMDGNWYGWGWGWMMLMPLIWIGLIALVVWAVVRLARPNGDGTGRTSTGESGSRESPLEILDRRLASGDIDMETYTRTRERLVGRDVGSP